MDDLELMKRALLEIDSLRKELVIKTARLEVFDTMTQLLHTQPARSGHGLSHPDLSYELASAIAEKEDKINARKKNSPDPMPEK